MKELKGISRPLGKESIIDKWDDTQDKIPNKTEVT